MVDVAIYGGMSKGYIKEVDRIPDIESIDKARAILLEMWESYVDNPEWNIKETKLNETMTEGHVFGFTRDEHWMLAIEDPRQQTTMEAWNARIDAREEMERFNSKGMA